MTSTTIKNYLNNKVKGNETDYEIECNQSFYGVTRITIISKELPCGCCKTLMKRKHLTTRRWTDGQGFKREAKMCPTCTAIAKDLYGI